LFLADGESRRRRAIRWLQLSSVQNEFEKESGWLIPCGVEPVWLYREACNSYINGMYLAALLCAHAACERVLAGCLLAYEESLPKGWRMWGLGKMIPVASERSLIDPPLKGRLEAISEPRKVSAHFKPPMTTNSVVNRVSQLYDDHAYHPLEDRLDNLLKTDALIALGTATELLHGDQGFARDKRSAASAL
jgi:hypothetical protein